RPALAARAHQGEGEGGHLAQGCRALHRAAALVPPRGALVRRVHSPLHGRARREPHGRAVARARRHPSGRDAAGRRARPGTEPGGGAREVSRTPPPVTATTAVGAGRARFRRPAPAPARSPRSTPPRPPGTGCTPGWSGRSGTPPPATPRRAARPRRR